MLPLRIQYDSTRLSIWANKDFKMSPPGYQCDPTKNSKLSHQKFKMIISIDCGIILKSWWEHFEILVGSFWNHGGIILKSWWDHFEILGGSFWNLGGIILITWWDHFKHSDPINNFSFYNNSCSYIIFHFYFLVHHYNKLYVYHHSTNRKHQSDMKYKFPD